MYNECKIQLLDLPGIIEGAAEGKGRGRQVIACAKTSDVILIVLDAAKEADKNHREILERELEIAGLRLNKEPANIYFRVKKTGGIKFNSIVPLTKMGHDPAKLVYQILHEYKIHNAEILFREDATSDEFVDLIEGNRKYVKCLYVYNKIDLCSMEHIDALARLPHSLVFNLLPKLNLEFLLAKIWEYMGLVRVYTKKKGEMPDLTEPVVISTGRAGGKTIDCLCNHLHKDLLRDFNYAMVWGLSPKHQPQRVGLSHALMDEDVVQVGGVLLCTGGCVAMRGLTLSCSPPSRLSSGLCSSSASPRTMQHSARLPTTSTS